MREAASGRLTSTMKWKWDPVKWSFYPDSDMYASNRIIPPAFWNKVWDKKKPVYRVAGVILIRNGRILVVQSYWNKFGFPKGTVNDNESHEDAARRELLEETGIRFRGKFAFSIPYRSERTDARFFVASGPELDDTRFPIYGCEITSIGYVAPSQLTNMNKNKITDSVYSKLIQTRFYKRKFKQ